MKYVIKIAYKGTRFNGWQRQPSGTSVQEVFEDTLRQFLGQKVNFIGCGRTDAGVHASGYFGHVVIEKAMEEEAIFVLNKMLPDDIAVLAILEAPFEFHAQHDAVSRTYEYYLHTLVNPFKAETSFFYEEKIDLPLLKELADSIKSASDFRAFCKKPEKAKGFECLIQNATWEQLDDHAYKFTITANRFLRGMIRLLVGSMLAVNEGKMMKTEFLEALKERKLPQFQYEAYPQGLYLADVKYPSI
ncbi:MAG: tRNA pseudouridine(38-40) synthase TruA [Saprospiraceae bacterium]